MTSAGLVGAVAFRDVQRVRLVDSARAVVAFGLLAAAVGGIAWTVTATVTYDSSIDFHSFREAVGRWLSGGSMYAPAQLSGPYGLTHSAGHVFVYPPTAMPMLMVLTSLGSGPYAALSTLLLLAALVALTPRTPLWIGIVCAAAAFSDPLVAAIGVGNVTQLLTALLAFAYLGSAGRLGAVAGLLKLTPGIMSALDGWRGIVTGVALAAGVSIVTLPLLGLSNWQDFFVAVQNARPSCELTTSVACLTGSTPLALGLGAILALGCLVTARRLVRLALVTAALLVTAPELYVQYFVYAYPLIVASSVELYDRVRSPKTAAPRLELDSATSFA